MNDARHARQVHHGQIDGARGPVVAGVLIEIHAGEHADGGGQQERNQTRQNVPTKGAHMPPAVMLSLGFSSRKENPRAGHALKSKYPKIAATGTNQQ